jgi:hypothetical protein
MHVKEILKLKKTRLELKRNRRLSKKRQAPYEYLQNGVFREKPLAASQVAASMGF